MEFAKENRHGIVILQNKSLLNSLADAVWLERQFFEQSTNAYKEYELPGAKPTVLGFRSSTNIVKNKYQMQTQYDYPTYTYICINTYKMCICCVIMHTEGCVPSQLYLTSNNFTNHLEPLHIVELQIAQIVQIVPVYSDVIWDRTVILCKRESTCIQVRCSNEVITRGPEYAKRGKGTAKS